MIDKLLELHGIRYVISVDDCYSNIREDEIKAVLFSEMSHSFSEFRQMLVDMGKKERLDDLEAMIEFSGEKDALIRDFLEDFSIEQLSELYETIAQKQSNRYTSEKQRLMDFLNKLKQENLVDGYETCMSTKEALHIDYEKKGQNFGNILWLIDRNFERVGEYTTNGKFMHMLTVTVGSKVTVRSKTNPIYSATCDKFQTLLRLAPKRAAKA